MKTPTMNDTVARLQREAEDAAGLEPLGRVLEGVEIDASARVTHCQMCNALIWFGRTRAGKVNPFDVIAGERTAVTHYSTCPRVAEFRERRKR